MQSICDWYDPSFGILQTVEVETTVGGLLASDNSSIASQYIEREWERQMNGGKGR